MRTAQDWFILMFLLRGLPFVDLAYLRKNDLKENVITYRRRKTGRTLSVTLTTEAMFLLQRYMNRDVASLYLFPILRSGEGTEEAYREYQLALRGFNHQLALLGELLGIKGRLNSYLARHTYASEICLSQGVPIETVSRMLGHRDLRSTQIYAKISNDKISEDTDKLEERVKDKFRLVGIEQ